MRTKGNDGSLLQRRPLQGGCGHAAGCKGKQRGCIEGQAHARAAAGAGSQSQPSHAAIGALQAAAAHC